MRTTRVLAMLVAVLAIHRHAGTAEVVRVSLVLDGPAGEPSRYAFEEVPTLEAARGQVIVSAGLPRGRSAAALIKSLGVAAPTAPECCSSVIPPGMANRSCWSAEPMSAG